MSEVGFGSFGKVEICVGDAVSNLKGKWHRDIELVRLIKEDFKEWVIKHHEARFMAWRDRGDNLILYLREKADEDLLLATRYWWRIAEYGMNINIRPVIEQGQIDHRCYRLKFYLDYRLALQVAMNEIEKRWWYGSSWREGRTEKTGY